MKWTLIQLGWKPLAFNKSMWLKVFIPWKLTGGWGQGLELQGRHNRGARKTLQHCSRLKCASGAWELQLCRYGDTDNKIQLQLSGQECKLWMIFCSSKSKSSAWIARMLLELIITFWQLKSLNKHFAIERLPRYTPLINMIEFDSSGKFSAG